MRCADWTEKRTKLTILDASALLSLLFGEPSEDEVAAILDRDRCALPATAVAEVVDRSSRRRGVPVSFVQERLETLVQGTIDVLPVDYKSATRAGALRAEHYHRDTMPLSLADCVLLSSASDRDLIASSDGPLVTLAGRLGIEAIALRDSSGRRPELAAT